MNYNPSPKSELATDKIAIQLHHALVEDQTLRKHFALTLAELHRRAAQHTNPGNFNECAASHLRLLGAQDFVDTFLNLAEATPVPDPRKDGENLPGNVASLPRKN
jgi:hypothetical protein